MTTSTKFGGPWTSRKLDILELYLDAYTTALKRQPFELIYVDAFAGSGTWNPQSGYGQDDYDDYRELLEGSAPKALAVKDKPFDGFVFIEKDPERAKSLIELRDNNPGRGISVVNDDANAVLPRFCQNMTEAQRAVAFLDPFATQVSWDMVEAIGGTRKIDCWILFPIGAISRMMPRGREPSDALAAGLDRIFGGREVWSEMYSTSRQPRLFEDEPRMERAGGVEEIARRYRRRLRTAFAGAAPTDRILRNSRNAPLFNLFFAAGNPKGAPIAIGIADHILKNW